MTQLDTNSLGNNINPTDWLEPIIATSSGERKTNRQLTEAELEQRRDAAQKSAEARRVAQAPQLQERWKNASPEEKGAMLFFLSRASKNRQAEIRKQLLEEIDPERRAELEGEMDDLEKSLREDNFLVNEAKRIAEEARNERKVRVAKRQAEQKLQRELRDQQQYARSIIDKINIGAKIRESQKRVTDLETQQREADKRVEAARLELDKVRQARAAHQKAFAEDQKRRQREADAQRARERVFRRVVANRKLGLPDDATPEQRAAHRRGMATMRNVAANRKAGLPDDATAEQRAARRRGVSTMKSVAANRKLGLPDDTTAEERAAHRKGVAAMKKAKADADRPQRPRNGTFVNGKWYDENDRFVGYASDPNDRNSPLQKTKPRKKKKK